MTLKIGLSSIKVPDGAEVAKSIRKPSIKPIPQQPEVVVETVPSCHHCGTPTNNKPDCNGMVLCNGCDPFA